MSRGNQAFKQGDITKALKGAVKAGYEPHRVVIEPGRISVDVKRPDEPRPGEPPNEWDDVR